jgi:hypothetical protein
MSISAMAVGLFLLSSVTDTLAQVPGVNIKDEVLSLNVSDAVYNSNSSGFLSSKNISSTPYRITEKDYLDQGLLNNGVNVTNSQTYLSTTYLKICLLGKEMERLRLSMDKISVGYLLT